mgnify:CR=1 FL=1
MCKRDGPGFGFPPRGLALVLAPAPVPSAATRRAWALGVVTEADGQVLDAWFPSPTLGDDYDDQQPIPAELQALAARDEVRGVDVHPIGLSIDLDAPPASTADAYLRLHLLSHRLVAPNTINLEGIFGVLPNVCLLYTSPSPRDRTRSRMPSSA